MKDEELAGLLRDAVREHGGGERGGGRDPRLEKLTLGELDAGAARALVADAEQDDELRRALALSRPLDSAALARMHARLIVEPADGLPAPLPGKGIGVVVGLDTERARRRRTWGAIAALGIAASIALAVGIRPAAAPIAMYEVSVESADVATRSGSAKPDDSAPLVQSSPRFALVARPSVAASEAIAARAYAVHAGRVHEWTTPVQISTDGSVKIAGAVTSLFDDPQGAWDVVVAVGHPGDAPPSEKALLGGADEVGGWRLLRTRVELRPR